MEEFEKYGRKIKKAIALLEEIKRDLDEGFNDFGILTKIEEGMKDVQYAADTILDTTSGYLGK